MSSSASENVALPLTEEQIAGLARLGDLGNQLGQLLDGPLAGPLASTSTRLGEVYSRYDLASLAQSFLGAADALNRSGWFAFIQNNADFFAQSMDVLHPLLSQWVDSIDRLQIDKIKEDIDWLISQIRRGKELSEFVEAQWSSEIVGAIVKFTELIQREETIPALGELMELLGQIHRSGLYPKLRTIAEYAGGLDEGVDINLLAGQLIRKLPADSLEEVNQVVAGARSAINEVQKHDSELGGLRGLFYLLKDKNVQKGLQMIALVPTYLSHKTDNPKA